MRSLQQIVNDVRNNALHSPPPSPLVQGAPAEEGEKSPPVLPGKQPAPGDPKED